MRVIIENNGQKFIAAARQAAVLESLMDTNGGGFATVKGYVSGTGYKADINFISRFSTAKLYERRIEALEALTLGDIMDILKESDKIKGLSVADLNTAFEERKAVEIASLKKTLEGDRDDNRRASNDRNYVTLTNGVKVNFVTELNKDDKQTYPVLDKETGLPMVGSIMLNIIEVSRNVIEEVALKPVNSGVPVLISNAMKAVLPKTTQIKNLSFNEHNFESLSIGNAKLMPKEFKGL
jgi:hypothetical protein